MLRREQNQHAFSLIEITVVIAVLAVLAVLILPLLSKGSEKAETMFCQNQLRDLWKAMNQYLSESGGVFIPTYDPLTRFNGTVPEWGPTWAEYFARFYFDQNKTILHCPSRPKEWGNAAGYYVDYAYNQRLPQEGYFVQIGAVTRPDEIVMFADSGRLSGGKRVSGMYSMADASVIHYRHYGHTANAVYVSGRISNYKDPGDLSRSSLSHPFHSFVYRDP